MPGILARLFGAERRDALGPFPASIPAPFGITTVEGRGHVTPHAAENLSAVLACVNAIASVIGSMTPRVYRASGAGRTELFDHPVSRLTRRPNDAQTWPDFIEWLLASVLLHGNALAAIDYDGAGRPVALAPVPWSAVQVVVLPSGRLAYDVARYTAPWGGTGRARRYLAGEVFHLKDRSDDGLVGRSRLSRARDVVGNAVSLQGWSETLWRNAVRPTGVFTLPHFLTADQRTQADARMGEYRAAIRRGEAPLLEGGWKFEPLSVSPEDAELLASRRFTVEEVCRLFQVPPPLAQDLSHGTFTNSREAGRWFAQFSLAPWARKIEAEFSRSVFGSSSADCHLEIDLSDLMRGDAEARWQSHKIAVEAGILDTNEVRELEGWSPRPQQAQQRPVGDA